MLDILLFFLANSADVGRVAVTYHLNLNALHIVRFRIHTALFCLTDLGNNITIN